MGRFSSPKAASLMQRLHTAHDLRKLQMYSLAEPDHKKALLSTSGSDFQVQISEVQTDPCLLFLSLS